MRCCNLHWEITLLSPGCSRGEAISKSQSRNMATQRESADLLIRGGKLLDPGSGIVGAGDIAVSGGKIIAVGKDLHSRFLIHFSQ